jgi:hypothetical protein
MNIPPEKSGGASCKIGAVPEKTPELQFTSLSAPRVVG